MDLGKYLYKLGKRDETTYKWEVYLEKGSFYIRIFDENTNKVLMTSPIEPYERMGNLYFFTKKETKYVFEFFM